MNYPVAEPSGYHSDCCFKMFSGQIGRGIKPTLIKILCLIYFANTESDCIMRIVMAIISQQGSKNLSLYRINRPMLVWTGA